MSKFSPFNAFITPDGKLLKFGSPHDVYAKTKFGTKVPELKRDGYVRVSWYMFNNVHPLIDAYDLKASLPAIQKALLPYYERLGNIPVTAYEQVKRSDKKDDHIIDTDLATLTLGTFRDIRDKTPFGERDNPGRKTIPVDVQDVIDNLEDTDGTGDPSWVAELSRTVERLGKNWLLGPVKIRTIQNDNTSDADDLMDGYAPGIENAPPVVLVPSKNSAYKWYVTDGAHRTATLELLGKKTVMAYYPELDE